MREMVIRSLNERLNPESNMALRRRYYRGEVVRLRRGCYFPAREWAEANVWQRYRLFTAAVGLELPETVFCLETAALHQGYPLVSVPREVSIAVPDRGRAAYVRGSALASPAGQMLYPGKAAPVGFAVRKRVMPVRAETALHDGLRLTARCDTLADCAARLPFADAVAIMDAARRPGTQLHVPRAEIEAAIAALPKASQRARAMAVLEFSSPDSESPGESLSRANIHLLGFAPPVLQHRIADADGEFARTDYYWPEANLAGEFDGQGKYLHAAEERGVPLGEVVMREKKREDRIRRTGIGVVRWDWQDARDLQVLRRILTDAGVPRAPRTRRMGMQDRWVCRTALSAAEGGRGRSRGYGGAASPRGR